jgi:hypothetical protein
MQYAIELLDDVRDILRRLNAGEEVSDEELASFLTCIDDMADHIQYIQGVVMTLTEPGYRERNLQ